MSQMSSQVLDPNWGSFPLAKFSHHTGPYGTKTHTWTHVNYRNDLDFVLKEVRLVDEYGCHECRSWLKINGGSEVLESQDLSLLVQYCREFNSSRGGDHPVELVIKCPFLAMKYPKTAQTVRRFQVKFRHEADFSRTVNILKGLGLPVVDRSSPTSIRPVMSPAPSVLSMASASTTRLSLPAPTSETHLGMQTPGASSNISFVSPTKFDFKIPCRPESVPSDNRTMTLGFPFSVPNNTGSFINASPTPSLLSAPQLSRMTLYHEAPGQSSSYLAQAERESQSRCLSHPVLQSSTTGTANDAASSLFVSQMHPEREELSGHQSSPSRLFTESPFFSSRNGERPSGSSTDALHELLSQRSFVERLASTPAQPADIQNLWIPPRRELPFPRPRDPARASSPVLDLPPLPKPTTVSTDGPVSRPRSPINANSIVPLAKPAPKKRLAQRKSTAKQAENLEPAAGATTTSRKATSGQGDELSPLAAKSASFASRPSSAAGVLVSKVAAPAKKRAAPARPSSVNKRAKMVDQGTQTDSSHTASRQPLASKTNAPDLVANSPSPPEEFLDRLDNFITQHRARPAPKELWETPGYANADEEQRQMMLNEFICENLGNHDFIQLCKDTEFAWRRMGLGL